MSELKEHLDKCVNVSWNFAGRCKTYQDHLMNAIIGLVSEAGELGDLHKKALFHTEQPDGFYKEKVKLELGDVMFYWLKVAELWGLSFDEILASNKTKLESRHPEFGKVNERFGPGSVK